MPSRAPIRFGHHSIAVLSAAILVSTIVALLITALLAIDTMQRPMGVSWLAMMATAIWVGVFIIALPSTAIILSMLWPVTRRMTRASDAICLLACATGGIILAPLASGRASGASVRQMLLFAAIGVILAVFYRIVAGRLGRTPSAKLAGPPNAPDGEQLELAL